VKIVTSGKGFLDIDAYAGCVAYAELLSLQGIEAIAFSSAPLNESVPKSVRSWGIKISNDYIANPEDSFILIDVSEPDFIEKTANVSQVEEVIDHHVGFEDFWSEKIGEKADIEFIGAACTQVYERWERAGILNIMNKISARLLVCGILDNTLNFKADVTTNRDVAAYRELLKIADLPEDWTAQYFMECETSIVSDINRALTNDTKILKFQNLNSSDIAFGQLVIWDAKQILNQQSAIYKTMKNMSEIWLVNVISISEGVSYILSDSELIKTRLGNILDINFKDSIAISNRLWLRKEIIKQDIAYLRLQSSKTS
jgi:inorganic pyrophosphatase